MSAVPPSPRKLSMKSMPSPRKLMSKTLKSVRGRRNAEKTQAKVLSSPATTLKKLFKTPSSRKQRSDSESLPSVPLMDLAEGDEEAEREKEKLEEKEERERIQEEIQNDMSTTDLPSPEEERLKKVEGLTAIAPPNLLLSDDEDEILNIPLADLEDDDINDDDGVCKEPARKDEASSSAPASKSDEDDDDIDDTDHVDDTDQILAADDYKEPEDRDDGRRTSASKSPKSPKSPGRRKTKIKKSKRRKKKKKSVCFSEGVLVYTDTQGTRERQAMFYSEQEMDDFRQDVAYHASILMDNHPDNGDYVQHANANTTNGGTTSAATLPQHDYNTAHDSGLCLLGVEHHFLNETYKQKQKLKAVLAVLMEQDRQYKEDGHFTPADDVSMSKCYQRVSRISHKEAHERGLRSLKLHGDIGDNGGDHHGGNQNGDTEPSSSASSIHSR
ncbi:unnamed protein product [Cylindrotheca closterium]|uniref:Uncharacterized protein n=1 Tax=Cylindrotheca closterium TaxID=2856 RepID=A0AAD2GB50_9STRA|nr:unnamed protein product [Cylindrotheca closterium]